MSSTIGLLYWDPFITMGKLFNFMLERLLQSPCHNFSAKAKKLTFSSKKGALLRPSL